MTPLEYCCFSMVGQVTKIRCGLLPKIFLPVIRSSRRVPLILPPPDKGGYSWRELKPGTWGSPTLEELSLAADALVSLVDDWSASLSLASPTFDMVGFSQGGALAATLVALHPARVGKVAVLSGFVPSGVERLLHPGLLEDIRFFWSHGTKDELISIERGRASIEFLENAGAEVQFCQAEIGHRVSKECWRSLATFLKN